MFQKPWGAGIKKLPANLISIHQDSTAEIMVWFGLWCLTPHSTIFQLHRGGQENGVPGESHQPVASH